MFSPLNGKCYTNTTTNITTIEKSTAVIDNITVEIGSITLHKTVLTGVRRKMFCDIMDVTKLSLMVLIFIFNLVLLIFILSVRKLRTSKSSKYFLNLQLVHVLLSVSGGYDSFFHYSQHPIEEVIINNGLLLAMFFSLTLTTLDRYVAIQYPYRYEAMKCKMVYRAIVVSWLIPLIFTGVGLCIKTNDKLIEKKLHITSTIVICASITVLVATNLKVHHIAKQAAQTLTKKKHSKVLKSTYVCFVLVGSFVVLWFPFLVHNVLTLCGVYVADSNKTTTRVVVQIAFLNSVLDPVLYVFFRKDVKREIANVFCARIDRRGRAETHSDLL